MNAPITRILAVALATTATATALTLSVGAGLERGHTVLVCLSVVLTLAVHLIPAISRGRALVAQAVGLIVWAGCFAFTCYGHGQFFVTGMSAASAQRADAVTEPAPSNARDLVTVSRERERVTRELAAVTSNPCADGCKTWHARIDADKAEISALDVEAVERHKWEASMDAWHAARQQAAMDPMRGLGVSPLVVGMVGAVVLEAVACFCWFVAIPVPVTGHAPGSVTAPAPSVTPSVAPPATPPLPEPEPRREPERPISRPRPPRVVTPPPTAQGIRDLASLVIAQVDGEQMSDVDKVRAGIAAGETRGTVAEIRDFLGVGTAKAQAIRRQLDF